MFLIGITGGIATGKSTVSKLFLDSGIPVIDCDKIARQIVEPGKPAWHKIRQIFGENVFDKDTNELDRDELGKLIFDDIEKRKILNEITHPEIHKTIYKEVFRYFLLGHNFIVLDLPLLFETRIMLNLIHKIITVTCEEDIQLTRLMDRNNRLSESDAKKRIKAQMPLEQKCAESHFVIENSGTLQDTEEQTMKIINLLQESNHHWKIRGILLATAAVLFSGIAWILNYKYKIFSSTTNSLN
uniref:Dephospho-CoA kinase domain-containing protein n=1 Tax=Corethrella appendiculata TaxID=1370023 RepID=U5EZN6_9DIPT